MPARCSTRISRSWPWMSCTSAILLQPSFAALTALRSSGAPPDFRIGLACPNSPVADQLYDASTAGLGAGGLFGPRGGISSSVFPGKLSGGGASTGSCSGGMSGPGLPGGFSGGGSVGMPGGGSGISGGSIAPAHSRSKSGNSTARNPSGVIPPSSRCAWSWFCPLSPTTIGRACRPGDSIR